MKIYYQDTNLVRHEVELENALHLEIENTNIKINVISNNRLRLSVEDTMNIQPIASNVIIISKDGEI